MVEVKISKKVPKYYDKKNEFEIIKKYQDLIMYAYVILKKYPENEVINLASNTKRILFEGLEYLVLAKHAKSKSNKLTYLCKLESRLNILNILIRVAKKNKYITSKNYKVWSFKIFDIFEMTEKWMIYCQS